MKFSPLRISLPKINNLETNVNIIIHDDDKKFIEALSLLLTKQTHFKIIDTCTNGFELINNINIPYASLLIINLNKSKTNALELAVTIKSKYPRLSMIAISMYYDKITQKEIKKAGFSGLIYKPDVSKQIIKKIKNILKNKPKSPS